MLFHYVFQAQFSGIYPVQKYCRLGLVTLYFAYTFKAWSLSSAGVWNREPVSIYFTMKHFILRGRLLPNAIWEMLCERAWFSERSTDNQIVIVWKLKTLLPYWSVIAKLGFEQTNLLVLFNSGAI